MSRRLNCDCIEAIPPGVECHTVGDAVPFLIPCALHLAAMNRMHAIGRKAARAEIVAWLREVEGCSGIADAILLRVADAIESLP